ncbi:MAG: FAD-dependent oxidoreductase [Candidatus Vogelbacteria bacterium CG10_big_fil_rev_8_21_14_0_10_51_16]|uniref:FAD-dependent oxidoreductase n=1 Tax=Candidatus Vogelbacteria bacterium CG10_big_fil_rev_8_21_14_0_10_51_16 TaxID=1975045 RepID=A0A2H0RFE1_9BACT|nr:MAG: FAD-dependent oxidoreductase [Candidatus Vogelbacteria bacterium CG10_big_fil_rev_8_21_14_0_10_51_16]
MSDDFKYDYLFIGTGNSALTAASLLANAGKKVCMLEAHEYPGGYAHTFPWGDFQFCAQVHYIWGCNPPPPGHTQGGQIYEFLKKIGLERELTFELFDPDGYDRMAMPDGKIVGIPYGFNQLVDNIEEAYPGSRDSVRRFLNIIERIRYEMVRVPDHQIRWWEYMAKGWRFLTLLKYKKKTLQEVFDECAVSKEAQAVLCAQAADFMLPPEKLSVFAFTGLFCGYGNGAFYPTKHYKHYFERIANFITEHRGCHIFYKSMVTGIEADGDHITKVHTKDGKTFTAREIVCNMDPQKAAEMIGLEKFPDTWRKKLDYDYSGSSLMVYLGLKDFDFEKYGLSNGNVWHMEQWDMNKIWKEQGAGDFSKPFFFISMPTHHSTEPGVAPPGHQIMEVGTYTEYKEWKELHDTDYKAYEAKKNALGEQLLDLVEKHYVPDLRKHIVVKVVGSPTTNEEWVWAPKGTAYGEPCTPHQIGPRRLPQETPFKNFYFCNATAGYAGIYGTTSNGIRLYAKLTGDRFYDITKGPTDKEFIEDTRKLASTSARG